MLFSGNRMIQQSATNIHEEIERAMHRDVWKVSTGLISTQPINERATLHVSMEVGEAQGRLTREIEIIWWPNLFSTSNGQLRLRYFLKKTSL